MNNILVMSAEMEMDRQKKTRALVWTSAVALVLALLFFFIRWKIPEKELPPPDVGFEVSLPFEEMEEELPPIAQEGGGGGGNDVMAPGDPGTAPPAPPQPGEEDSKDVVTNDDDKEAPPIRKPDNPKPTAKNINNNSPSNTKIPTPNPKPPAPPQPKATLGKTTTGNGTGGNNANTYDVAGGKGNGSGVGNGNGTGGGNGNGSGGGNGNGVGPKNFGVKVFSVPKQSFEDDFDQKGKVAMDVVVNDNGKVISATYQPKGSTGTATGTMKEIARRRAFELKNLPPGTKGTVVFNFKVQ
jgi:hypothetical protein